jgi:hypothetical protein
VSFPKPAFGGQSFTGPSTNWNLLNLATPASNVASAIDLYAGVPASLLLFDSATNKVYDPEA